MRDLLAGAGAILTAVTLALLAADSAARLARRLAPRSGIAIRLCAIAVIVAWLAEAGFLALSSAGLFRLVPGLLFWGAVALAARTLEPELGIVAAGAEGRAGLRQLAAELRGPERLVAGATVTLVFVRLLHGLLAPPLAWDTLTYHLVKVARWLQTGAFPHEAAPDSTGFYEYFPHGGEVLWAWGMLPFHSDAPLAICGLAVWLAVLAGMYALARELGGSRRRSLLLALAVANVPSVLVFLTSGYVENVTLAGCVLGSAFLARLLRGGDASEAPLAIGGFTLAASTKLPAVPILAAALFAAATVLLLRRRFAAIAGCVAVALAAAPPYLRGLHDRGSLTWPVPVTIAGRALSRGSESLALVLSGSTLPGPKIGPGTFLLGLFFDVPSRTDLMNPGPAVPFLVLVGLVGWFVLWRREPRVRSVLAFFAIAAAIPILSLAGSDATAMRTWWASIAGRFLTISIALLAVPAAGLAVPVESVLLVVAAAGLLLGVPHGICREEAGAAVTLGVFLAACAAAILFALRLRRRIALPLAVLVLVLFSAGWLPMRARLRWWVWRAASELRAFDVHPLDPKWAAGWSVWLRFDDGTPHRVAAAAGWNGIGDNWYRYPLFGSRLQNTVVYVPITRDGSVVDYRRADLVASRADVGSWIRRLADARIDSVALLAPPPPERFWAERLPDVFPVLFREPSGLGAAFRFERDAALRRLDSRR